MSESSAGSTPAAASAPSASTANSSPIPSSSPAAAPLSHTARSTPSSLPVSTFPTYASSSSSKQAAGSAAYFAPPNTSYLSTAATATATPTASSILPASFTSPHPLASSSKVVASSSIASSSSSAVSSPQQQRPPPALAATNAILVSPRQRGNPVLSHIRNCPWEFAPPSASSSPPSPPFLCDYLLGPTTCALYLSLRYHLLHPLYLLSRMQPLRSHYTVRLLLLQVDVDDSEAPLTDVSAAAFVNGWTLLLGWSVDEIGRWLELFKVMQSKGKEALEGAAETGDEDRVRDVLAVVKGVNKTDTAVLVSTFGSLTALARASEAELLACVGMGAKKVKRLRMAFNQPFISSQAVRPAMGSTPVKPAAAAAAHGGAAGEEHAAAGEERKETGKRASEENDKERTSHTASPSQSSLFASTKKQRTGAIIRLDD